MRIKSTFYILGLTAFIVIYNFACSKSSPPAVITDACTGKNIIITTAVTNSAACGPTGSIAVSATGSTGFTYKLNSSGIYQTSSTFNNIGAASYTIFVKDASGCEKSAVSTVNATGTPGFIVNTVIIPASNCGGSDGSISISTSGSSGFMYKLNNGAYQVANTFTNLSTSNNTITVKDITGCEVTATANVPTNTTPGPKFGAVKNLILGNCSGMSCHTNGGSQGGRNFDIDCNIVNAKDRIRQRAVTEGTMPQGAPLSTANKAIITDWINAGGTFNN